MLDLIEVDELNAELYRKLYSAAKPLLLINCGGGSCAMAESLMRLVEEKEASAVNIGRCYSAAAHIFFCCKRRYALMGSEFMMHHVQMSNGLSDAARVARYIEFHTRSWDTSTRKEGYLSFLSKEQKAVLKTVGELYLMPDEFRKGALTIIKSLKEIKEN